MVEKLELRGKKKMVDYISSVSLKYEMINGNESFISFNWTKITLTFTKISNYIQNKFFLEIEVNRTYKYVNI